MESFVGLQVDIQKQVRCTDLLDFELNPWCDSQVIILKSHADFLY